MSRRTGFQSFAPNMADFCAVSETAGNAAQMKENPGFRTAAAASFLLCSRISCSSKKSPSLSSCLWWRRLKLGWRLPALQFPRSYIFAHFF